MIGLTVEEGGNVGFEVLNNSGCFVGMKVGVDSGSVDGILSGDLEGAEGFSFNDLQAVFVV